MNFLWEHQDSVSLITTDFHHLGMCVSDMVWTVKGLFPDLPVVIITGHGPSGYHLFKEGLVDEYMDKPFEPAEYVNMIKRFLN